MVYVSVVRYNDPKVWWISCRSRYGNIVSGPHVATHNTSQPYVDVLNADSSLQSAIGGTSRWRIADLLATLANSGKNSRISLRIVEDLDSI